MVAAWSVDRLGRSMADLVAFLTYVRARGTDLYLHQQALDTSTPSGRAMFQIMGVFDEYERAIIRERVNAGLARAKAEGKKLGRSGKRCSPPAASCLPAIRPASTSPCWRPTLPSGSSIITPTTAPGRMRPVPRLRRLQHPPQ
ncbi:recombinase family protein [Xanthobacter sp. V7C-4]|uniref:recombinase family protein n=1 Tax=Xanthobacter autotrophicus (strain ATCC BAA-1158 / Py2) TaxID=78245 RepID=UPI00372CC09A